VDFLFVDYWPWWFSAGAFAVVIVGMWVIERRLLGVSGSYTELVRSRPEGSDALSQLDESSIEDAMLKATLEEFGPEAIEAFEEEMAKDDAPLAPPMAEPRASLDKGAHLAFLVMMVVGGAASALLSGSWEIRMDLGALHTSFLSDGAIGLAILLVGGLLVGFGTRMAGGCTTGHGFSGCSRLQPGSLIATASFFGTAVGVSFLLEILAR